MSIYIQSGYSWLITVNMVNHTLIFKHFFRYEKNHRTPKCWLLRKFCYNYGVRVCIFMVVWFNSRIRNRHKFWPINELNFKRTVNRTLIYGPLVLESPFSDINADLKSCYFTFFVCYWWKLTEFSWTWFNSEHKTSFFEKLS